MILPKHSAPYWSNPRFLIQWHSGTLALSPELDRSMALNTLKCNHLASVGLKGLISDAWGTLLDDMVPCLAGSCRSRTESAWEQSVSCEPHTPSTEPYNRAVHNSNHTHSWLAGLMVIHWHKKMSSAEILIHTPCWLPAAAFTSLSYTHMTYQTVLFLTALLNVRYYYTRIIMLLLFFSFVHVRSIIVWFVSMLFDLWIAIFQ